MAAAVTLMLFSVVKNAETNGWWNNMDSIPRANIIGMRFGKAILKPVMVLCDYRNY